KVRGQGFQRFGTYGQPGRRHHDLTVDDSCTDSKRWLDYRNVALGLAVLFLSRMLALHYFMNDIDDTQIRERSRRHLALHRENIPRVFLVFLVSLLFAQGWSVVRRRESSLRNRINTCTIVGHALRRHRASGGCGAGSLEYLAGLARQS
ncbi:MAG: hypothetical protein ACLVJK_02780, partial [Alistipes putredinis]